ncbi:protein NATD1 isoform X1 [Otolemur garnettii]|uniref:protein NATD1 isoform X1 n=1 Tax=Otolemur garnettii TaxID=30611 RepID=UPI000C7EAEC9|nr:protein NATD1 isoform X1 [Otolemur garnettii]
MRNSLLYPHFPDEELRHRGYSGFNSSSQMSPCLSLLPRLHARVHWAPEDSVPGLAELPRSWSPYGLTCLPTPPGCHDRAVLLYEYVGKRVVDLQHTEVPDAYRGRGIAKHLAKAALDFVVEEDLKAHLTCWYIQKYVKENPLPQYLERLQP